MDLHWSPVVSVGDVLTAAALFLTATGLLFAGMQLRRNTKAHRAQFLLEVSARYFSDDNIRRFSQKLDWQEFTFLQDKFPGSEEELRLDNLLYMFDIIGCMVRLSTLTVSEARIMAYQASRVLRNPEVSKYLTWLESVYAEEGIGVRPHDDARYLVEQLGIS